MDEAAPAARDSPGVWCVMRVIRLSDHPGDMLQQEQASRAAEQQREQARYEAQAAGHAELLAHARSLRAQAWSQHRWGTWLRAVLAVRRTRRQAPPPPSPPARPADREQIWTAGVRGEQLAETALARRLGDEWVLLRGYRNRGGEIDHLLIGPRGLFAIESKHINGILDATGEHWYRTRLDQYGNPVGDREEIHDGHGRSPAQQVSQPAAQLQQFLRSRGLAVTIEPIVLFTHDRSRIRSRDDRTARAATLAEITGLLNASPARLNAAQREQAERLIIHDYDHHRTRRTR